MDIFSDTPRDSNNLLPSLDELRLISFSSSYGKSLNKLKLSEDLLETVIKDAARFYNMVLKIDFLYDYCWRVKSEDSIRRKYKKGIDKGLRFQTVFNDIIGLRIRVPSYALDIPDYFRVVDLSNGKSFYDGYKAVHLYYKLDNFHYTVEIQLWSDADYDFNSWSHELAYKSVSDEVLAELRANYDMGLIKNKEDFTERVSYYVSR